MMFTRNALRLAMVAVVCTLLALTMSGCKKAPTVVSTNPADGATEVALDTTVTATFSKKVHADSINGSTFTLRQGATLVPGTVTYDADTLTATFTPANPLSGSTLYTAAIAKGAGGEKSLSECIECYGPIAAAGVAIGIIAALLTPDPGLPEDYLWTFTTVDNIPTNNPPIANAGPLQQVNLPIGADAIDVTLDGSGSTDPAKSIVSYTWTGNPDPEDVVRPTVTLGPGTHVFTLVVTDNEGAVSEPSSVTINVNIPPVAEADAGEDQNVNVPPGAATVDVTLDGSDSSDTDGTIVAYAWTGEPDPEDVMNPVVTLGPGVHVFSLIVTDDKGAVSLADTVTITVNTPPVANAGPDQNINLPLLPPVEDKAFAETVSVTLDGSASTDSDGTIVSYAWTGPVDPEDVVSPAVTLGAGDYVFSLVVTDDKGAVSVADTVLISVNTPPVANAGPDQQLNLPLLPTSPTKADFASSVEVTLDGSASADSDGTIVSYAWTGTPDPADNVNPTVLLEPGEHVFTLVVTDNDGAVSEADTVVISVNAPPVANAGPDQFVNLPLLPPVQSKAAAATVDVTLDGSGSTDSDGTIVSYEWIGTPDPADTASPTVTLGAGQHLFSLVVTDNDGAASVADTVLISVNTPPVADAGPDQNVNIAAGQTTVNVTLDGSGSSDSDGTIAAYAWSGTPDPADSAGPTVALGAGTHVFTLVVTDNDGAASTEDAVIIFVNAPPTANAGPDQALNIPLGQSTVNVTLNGGGSSDSDGTIAAYAWTGTPDPANTVSPTLSLGSGEYTFTLVVTDDDGAASAADTVTISVNAPPVAVAGNDRQVTIPVGASTVNVTLNGLSSTDSDGTVVGYFWTGTPDPLDTPTPSVGLASGVYTFTLYVVDNDGAASADDSITITVNAPPVANAGPDQQFSLPVGASTINVTLDASGSSDPDGSIALYNWSGTPNPADTVNPVVALGAGTHTFDLFVRDDDGADSAADTVIIFVNAPPVANAGPDQHVNLPEAVQLGKADGLTVDVTLDGSGSTDSDGNIVSYAWTGAVDPADTVGPVVSLGMGEHVFTLIVTDDDGAVSAADTVTIFVNSPPVAFAGEDQIVSLQPGSTAILVTLDGTGSYDADGTVASYAWTGTPDPADTAGPGVLLGAGDHVFTLIVTDDDGAASAADTVTISVNSPPVANAGPDQLVTLPFVPVETKATATSMEVTLDGTLSTDADGTIASYAWTGPVDPADTSNPVVNLGPGVHTFTLVVTDDDGAVSEADTVVITVNQPPIAVAGDPRRIDLPLGVLTADVTLDGSTSHDIDGSVVSYAWTGTPDPADSVNPTVTLGPGTHQFTLTVTDNRGAVSEPSTVTIDINQSPVAEAGPDQNLNLPIMTSPVKGAAPGSTLFVNLDGGGSFDPDGTISAYTWTGTPDPLDTVTPTVELGAGVHVFTLVVADNWGAVSVADTVTITINTPPVAQITATPNPVQADSAEPAALTYDPGVLYGLQQYGEGSLFLDYLDPADGTVTGSVQVVLGGLSWELRSGYGLAADPTTGTFWAILEVMEPSEQMHLILATLDPLTGAAQYVGEYGETDPQPNDLTCGDDGTLYASADMLETPVKAFSGPGLYIVDKTDGALTDVIEFGDSEGQDAIAYLTGTGLLAHAYRNTTGDAAIELIDPATLDVIAYPPAPPAETYAWSWPTGLAFESDSGSLFLAQDVDMTGSLFTIALSDEGGTDALLADDVTVYGDLVFGFTKRAVPEIVQLDGSTSYDPDGDTIATYAWSVISVPPGSAVTDVSDPTIVNPTLTPDVLGDYVVSLVVNDGKVDSAPTPYLITYENTPPVADAGPDVNADWEFGWIQACLDGSASFDADYDGLTYSWAVTDGAGDPVPGFFVPGETSAAVCFMFSESFPMPGDYTATLTVTEDKTGGEVATDTAIITVQMQPTK